jgi:hypothetical protein
LSSSFAREGQNQKLEAGLREMSARVEQMAAELASLRAAN